MNINNENKNDIENKENLNIYDLKTYIILKKFAEEES